MKRFEWRDGEPGSLRAGEHRLETLCVGPAPDEASTLVLLHEGLGSVSTWWDFPARLAHATGFGVFAYSRAGYGSSDPVRLPRPLDYLSREAHDVLPGVLDAIGLRRGVLLGHSDGASIAALYAGGVSDHRVRGLVLVAPHFFTEPSGLAAIRAVRESYDAGDLRERLARHHSDVDNAFRGWNEAWLDPGFEDWNIGDAIDHVRVPTLAVQGEDDQYGTIRQIEELETRSYAPVEVEILAGCRHAPHVDRPDRTLAAIAAFCERLERIDRRVVDVV